MSSTVLQATVLHVGAASAIEQIHQGLDVLFAAGIDPVDGRDAEAWIRSLEGVGRRVDAARSDLVGAIDHAGLHVHDGHGSAKIMVRHHAKLTAAEAAARERTADTCRDLPELADAWRAGQLGTCQMRILGRVHANPRVAAAMEARRQRFLDDAQHLNAKTFADTAYRWARLIDQDGPEPAGERSHPNRDTKLIPDPLAGTWTLTGNFGSLQGTEMREILDHYIDAEFRTDWETAKARLGESVTKADLDRTDAQRRADALHRLFQDAAASPAGAVPPGFVHNIVWDADTSVHVPHPRRCRRQPDRSGRQQPRRPDPPHDRRRHRRRDRPRPGTTLHRIGPHRSNRHPDHLYLARLLATRRRM